MGSAQNPSYPDSAPNKEFMDFIYLVSHDLNAPMRQAREMSRLLVAHLAGRTDESDQKYLRHILSSTEKSEKMMAALVEYFRISAAELRPMATCPRTALDQACQRLGGDLEGCDLAVDTDSLPAEVYAEPGMLAQLFHYLMDNAVKFRSKGLRPAIRVYVKADERDHCFCIEDNGIGVPEDQCANIFHIFRRLHPEGTYPGVGAGLALAQQIVTRHGGHIRCEAASSGGSTFTFCLPRASRIVVMNH